MKLLSHLRLFRLKLKMDLVWYRWIVRNRARDWTVRLQRPKVRGFASGGLHERKTAHHDPVSALATAIYVGLGHIGITGTAVATASVIAAKVAVAAAVSAGMMLATRKKEPKSPVMQNGHKINTRMAAEPMSKSYGVVEKGGTWVFARPSGTNNEYLDVVVAWGEGEWDGVAPVVEDTPIFFGTGLDDLETGGIYRGEDGQDFGYSAGLYDGISETIYCWEGDPAWWITAAGGGQKWADGTGALSHKHSMLRFSGSDWFSVPWYVENGKTYKVTFTVSSLTAGSFTPYLGGVAGAAVSSNGSHEQTIVAAADQANLTFVPTNTSRFTIGNVQIVEVNRSWAQYCVQIDGVGSPNTFTWSKFGSEGPWEAAGVALTGSWQSIGSGGVQIKGATTGHTMGDKWLFYGSREGVFIGERLLENYRHVFSYVSTRSHTYPWLRDLVSRHQFYAGTAQQTVDATLQGIHGVWNEAMRNVAYSIIRLRYDREAWASSPEFRVRARTSKLYDPRTGTVGFLTKTEIKTQASAGATSIDVDSTAGMEANYLIRIRLDDGTPHETFIASVTDADTVVITTAIPAGRSAPVDSLVEFDGPSNPGQNGALAWRDWLTNARYSIGIPVALVPDAYVSAAANWLDSAGYLFNGSMIEQKPISEHLDDMMRCFFGFYNWVGGEYRVKILTDDTPVMTLTENDIEIGADSFTIRRPGVVETPKKVVAQFINPEKNWSYDEAPYTEVDPGDFEPHAIDLPFVTDAVQALKTAKFWYLRLRRNLTFQTLCRLRVHPLEPGDCVQVTHDYPGWTNKKLRVETIGLPQRELIPVTFRDEDSSLYSLSVNTATATPWSRRTRRVVVPQPTNVTITTGADEQTENKKDAYLEISWDYMGYGYDYIVSVRPVTGGAGDYREVEDPLTGPGSTVTVRVGGLPPGRDYTCWVRTNMRGLSLSKPAYEDATTWEPAYWEAYKNIIINGMARVHQRGNTFTLVNNTLGMTVDRFWGGFFGSNPPGAGTFDRGVPPGTVFGQTNTGFRFFQVTSTGASSELRLLTRIESVNARIYINRVVSTQVKLWHNGGSGITGGIEIFRANSTDNFSAVTSIGSVQATIPTNTTTVLQLNGLDLGNCENGLEFRFSLLGAAYTAKNFYFTEIQAEMANVCGSIEFRDIQVERLLCMRYYETSIPDGGFVNDGAGITGASFMRTQATSSYHCFATIPFKVKKRVTPTVTLYNPISVTTDEIRNITDSTNHPHFIQEVNEYGFVPGVNNNSIGADKFLAAHWAADAEL